MSATPARSTWLVSLSLTIYRTLLLLYPARFRHDYGQPMVQVFRATCRQAMREGGALRLARVWHVTLGDLIVTALAERYAERYEEVMAMERRSLNRAAGLAGLMGGVLLLLYGLLEALLRFVYFIPAASGLNAVMNDTRSPWFLAFSWAPTFIMPVAWACMIVALWGLSGYFARRGSWEVWLAGSVTLIGAIMCLLGTFSLIIGSWNSWYYWHNSVTAYESQVSGDPLPYLAGLDLFGHMMLGLGLLALALLALRASASGRIKALTFILGACALLPFAYVYLAGPGVIRAEATAHGAIYGAPLPYTPFSLPFSGGLYAFVLLIAIIDAAFPVIWGACWLLLGVGFLRGGGQATAEQPVLGLAA